MTPLKPLKNLIAIKSKAKPKIVANAVQTNTAQNNDKSTYYDEGYKSSRKASGNSLNLDYCLNEIYQKFGQKCKDDTIAQAKLKEPYENQKEKLKTELKGKETLIETKEEDIEELDRKISKINNDINDVEINPKAYGVEATKQPKVQLIIGLAILLPITLYLLVFYISASYSSFFKNFDSNANVITAIFDAKALSKAWAAGWLEAVFVCTIPFAFMGLGYLIHMFQKEKEKGTYKIIALFVVTFIFDMILAYQIEAKIYNFNKTISSPPFDFSIAIQSVEFWGIIFAGFVVYVIWGLVFDFIMKEYAELDKVNVFIKKLRAEKINLNSEKQEKIKLIQEARLAITDINGEITELQAKIDGFIFPQKDYLLYNSEYVNGWLMAISEKMVLAPDEKDKLLKDCKSTNEKHLANLGISPNGANNVVYAKNLNDNEK